VSTDVSEEHIAFIFRVKEIISARNQQACMDFDGQQETLFRIRRVLSAGI
jgi:hypothetical protein